MGEQPDASAPWFCVPHKDTEHLTQLVSLSWTLPSKHWHLIQKVCKTEWNGVWRLDSGSCKVHFFFFFLHYCPRPAFVSPTHLFCFLRSTNEGNGDLGPYKAILARSQLRHYDTCFHALVGGRRFCLYFQTRRYTHPFQSDVPLFSFNFLNPDIGWKCSYIHWTHAHIS